MRACAAPRPTATAGRIWRAPRRPICRACARPAGRTAGPRSSPRYRLGDDDAAIAHDADMIRDLKHFAQMVGHVEDRGPRLAETPDDVEQMDLFMLGQARCRLVEDEKGRRQQQGLGDLDHLLLRHAEMPDETSRIDRHAELVQAPRRTGALPAPPDRTQNRRAASRPTLRLSATERSGAATAPGTRWRCRAGARRPCRRSQPPFRRCRSRRYRPDGCQRGSWRVSTCPTRSRPGARGSRRLGAPGSRRSGLELRRTPWPIRRRRAPQYRLPALRVLSPAPAAPRRAAARRRSYCSCAGRQPSGGRSYLLISCLSIFAVVSATLGMSATG